MFCHPFHGFVHHESLAVEAGVEVGAIAVFGVDDDTFVVFRDIYNMQLYPQLLGNPQGVVSFRLVTVFLTNSLSMSFDAEAGKKVYAFDVDTLFLHNPNGQHGVEAAGYQGNCFSFFAVIYTVRHCASRPGYLDFVSISNYIIAEEPLIHSVCVLIIAISGLYVSVAQAEIYRYVDESGRVVYSSEKPANEASARQLVIHQNAISSMQSYDEATGKSIVMYSATWCGVCMRARAYFHDQGIVYDEFDVENDPQGRQGYNRLGRSGVPIILVGDRRIDGFSIARFQQLSSADN